MATVEVLIVAWIKKGVTKHKQKLVLILLLLQLITIAAKWVDNGCCKYDRQEEFKCHQLYLLLLFQVLLLLCVLLSFIAYL